MAVKIRRLKKQAGQECERVAILYFERLLSKERDSRVYNLHWLLASMLTSGVHGLEGRLAEVERWQGLTGEEQN